MIKATSLGSVGREVQVAGSLICIVGISFFGRVFQNYYLYEEALFAFDASEVSQDILTQSRDGDFCYVDTVVVDRLHSSIRMLRYLESGLIQLGRIVYTRSYCEDAIMLTGSM